MNPPPERPADANDGVPEPRQGQSVSGKGLRLNPGTSHLADRLLVLHRTLCRHEKNQRQEDEPCRDQLLENHGFHGRTLKRPAGEPGGLNSGETLQDCGETVEIGGEPEICVRLWA
jgi:hypothetical protein